MENGLFAYLVYENWPNNNRATIHRNDCGHIGDGLERVQLNNNTGQNDRWFGPFQSLNEAVAFAALLPNRQMRFCSFCLQEEKEKI